MNFKYLTLTIFFLYLYSSPSFAQDIFFYKERITITIDKDKSTVEGIYYFKNQSNSPVKRLIFYPFSDNYNLSNTKTICVYDLYNKRDLPFTNSKKHILFNLSLQPKAADIIQIKYSQISPQSVMEYILLTTEKWKRPLDKAEYIILLSQLSFVVFCIFYISFSLFMPYLHL